ncbi:MAG: type II toxin-antitoxin system ParD family antitoxin [Nodularia sp. CChRGM 3473]
MKTITLTLEQENLIQNLLITGKFNNVSEVIQAALCLLEQESLSYQAWVEETRILVDEGIESLEHGEGIDGETFVNKLLADLQKAKDSYK